MSEQIGRIVVAATFPSGVFPLKSLPGTGVAIAPLVQTFQFGSGNAKIEQRFIIGKGVRSFNVRTGLLNKERLDSLISFWEARQGAYHPFYYDAPDGQRYTVRFKDETLTLDYIADCLATTGITLVEVPETSPSYNISQTCTRFPNAALNNALADQVQQIIPLIRIRVREGDVADIHLSDRRVTVGGNVYQPRLLKWDGIGQSIDGSSDQASFTFGNADRVITALANDTELWRAAIEFSLFHVGTLTKLDVWKGEIKDWSFDAGTEFKVQASDGIYELTLPYPGRRISRTCWKQFADGVNCPYSGSLTDCAKDFGSCRERGMDNYFGGIAAKPQAVRTKDNSTGHWGYGRSPLTSTSQVADSIYSETVPELYHDDYERPLPVNCKLVSGRDEGDFYCALGIVGEGPLGGYAYNTSDKGSYAYHKLDGQPAHGPGRLGLRESLGNDPNPDPFSLGEGGHGQPQRYGPERAAGTAFIEIRRKDDKGLQLSRLSEHSMEAYVTRGLSGWTWSAAGRSDRKQILTNPIWIVVNAVLRARGLFQAPAADQEKLFDVAEAIQAAAICDQIVPCIVTGSRQEWVVEETGTDEYGNPVTEGHWETVPVTEERQFRFSGILREEKPLRDWIQEILANCLGYYTFTFGKLKFGTRFHSGAQSAFTEGNIVLGSLELSALTPSFNHLTANFADQEYDFVNNSVVLYDVDHARKIGGAISPLYLKSQINLSGTSTKSQAARILTARLREELGGVNDQEQRKARKFAFKTTVLAMEVDPGMICSLDHPDLPDGRGEFRVLSWKLNSDYSIDIQGQTTTDSMYDMLAGPKPTDVMAGPLPVEEHFAPDDFGFYMDVPGNGSVILRDWFCKVHPVTVHQARVDLFYVPEDRIDLCAMMRFTDNGDGTAEIAYHGEVPVAGEWVLIDGELMEVVSITPANDASGVAQVKRAQVGTEAQPHGRVQATPTSFEDNLAVMTVAGDFKPGNLITTDPAAEWNIISNVGDAEVEVIRPFTDLDGQAVYSDPRIYRVVKKSVVIPFAPRFFVSAARAAFSYEIDLPNAGLVSTRAVLENTRGIRSYAWDNHLMPNFPFRWRTSGNNGIALTYPQTPVGLTVDAFNPVRIPATQAWDGANADLSMADGPVVAPRTVTSVVPASAQPTGTVTIGGTIKAGDQIGLTISGTRNHVSIPVFTITDQTAASAVASALANWVNASEEFAAFYSASASDGVVSITDKAGLGGTLSSSCSGGVTAAVAGLTSTLGVQYGRRYALSFKTDAYESALSPASVSSGPTGGASSISLKGIPNSEDSRVTTVCVWATPDGKEGPFKLVGSVSNGTDEFSDPTTETALEAAAVFPGPVQPETGSTTVMVKKDGWPWFQLRIVNGRSNTIHPFALGATPEGTTINADIDCTVSGADLRIFVD